MAIAVMTLCFLSSCSAKAGPDPVKTEAVYQETANDTSTVLEKGTISIVHAYEFSTCEVILLDANQGQSLSICETAEKPAGLSSLRHPICYVEKKRTKNKAGTAYRSGWIFDNWRIPQKALFS